MEVHYNNKLSFKFLTEGSTFLFEDKLYMKTVKYMCGDDVVSINAVNLETGELCFIDLDVLVIKVDSRVDIDY